MSRPGFTSWVRSHRLLAGVGAVALAVAGSVGVVTALGGGSGDDDDDGHRPQIREELLEGLEPNPDCPDAEQSPEPGEGEVLITVVRVADGCLRYSGEAVPAGQVDERLEELRADPGVVAADRVVERRPGGTERPGGVERSEQPTTGQPAPADVETSAGRPAGDRQQDQQDQQDQPDQWALAPEHLDGEAVRRLWPAGPGGPGAGRDGAPEVRVAVIDTGIDDQHPDLADQIAERAPWAHRYEGDYDDHGTHVAGIVAAADDGAGVVGLTPGARLMDVQYWNDRTNDDGHLAGPSDDLGEYVRWAVDHGADVINMSIQGADPSDTELTAVLYAERHGVVVIGISGNCGGEDAGVDRVLIPDHFEPPCRRRHEVKYPAGYDTVLSVANHTRDGGRADTSSANATVDVAAPGSDILSTCLSEPSDMRHNCSESGTSMAAPHVAATAALLRARHPDATPAAIREAITRSARTGDHQPQGRRTDDLGWGLLDPEAAARYLDEHPGGPQPTPSPTVGRTQAAFVDVGGDGPQLFAFDDGILHPVRDLPSETGVSSVDWSADGSQLVGTDPNEVFLWNGPASSLDSEVFASRCEGCRAAVVPRSSGNELVAAIGDDGVIAQFDLDTLEPGGTVELQLPEGGDGAVLRGDAGGRLLVAHPGGSDATAPDTLSLVDPLSGEQVAEHGPDGTVEVGAVAVDAGGERIAYADGPCSGADTVYVLDGGDLEEVSTTGMPTSPDLGELQVEDLFFNGDALYATMSTTGVGNDGPLCPEGGSAGLWRLADGGERWEPVDAEPVEAVRPIEGLTDEPGTGRLTIFEDSDTSGVATAHRGTFDPTGGSGADILNLGSELAGSLWATPTRTEVDLADGNSPPPVTTTTTTRPSGGGGGGSSSDRTTAAAIARYEEFLHALGEGDIDTLCEIAGPAARAAEEEHGIPCEMGYSMVVNELMSPEQTDALRTATVDPARVETLGTGGEAPEVHIPASAVVADVPFTDSDLGDYILAYQDGNWFIVG